MGLTSGEPLVNCAGARCFTKPGPGTKAGIRRYVRRNKGWRANGFAFLPWALDPQFEALISPPARIPRYRGIFPSGRVILTVGRWLATERYKGMDTLITARQGC